MNEKKIYVIHRVYSKKEKYINDRKSYLYGWTDNKSILKAFLSQRTKSKYGIDEIYADPEDILDGQYNDLDSNNMLNYIILKSVNNKIDDYYFFMTYNELQETEKRIQKYFRDLCSISNIYYDDDYLGMLSHINEYYARALDFIGYRPPELSAMYPSADYTDDPGEIIGITELIDSAYCGAAIHPYEEINVNGKIPGLSMLTDISTKIIYSVESFIKVLKDDL